MPVNIHDFRCNLINKILFSTSQDEVKKNIAASMKFLTTKPVAEDLMLPFIERISKDLSEFNPMDQGAQQWANIKMARIQFNQIKRSLKTTDYC